MEPSHNLLEVPVGNLSIGMYVAELDRPWLDTPFAVQGFYIKQQQDIDALARYCSYVLVDPRRARKYKTAREAPPQRKVTYSDSVGLKEEFRSATPDLAQASQTVVSVFEKLKRGRPLDVPAMSQAINPLIDSVLRNKDALAALVRIKKKDDYTYGHCLSTAVWATVLGRHLGLGREQLRKLAFGSALIDVGKIRLPDSLLSRAGPLSNDEVRVMRGHVEHSLEIIDRADDVDAAVREIVALHHERHDGTGYPRKLAGTAIPLLARIAGLVDSYDAMTTPRPYAAARSSFEAMQELADLRDVKFQGELVEQFMQAIGLFPTGALVELNTGEVAIVVAQNTTRRLKPRVIVVLDEHKKRKERLVELDLLAPPSVDDGPPLWITKELPQNAYGIDPEEFYL